MQKHLLRDFTRIYHVDLHGDVTATAHLAGRSITYSVFRLESESPSLFAKTEIGLMIIRCSITGCRSGGPSNQKLAWLAEQQDVSRIKWQALAPNTWLELEMAVEFDALIALGSKETKKMDDANAQAIFKSYTVGVLTARDDVAYDFNHDVLVARMEKFVDDYNAEVDRYHRAAKQKKKLDIDKFVREDLKMDA